MKTRDSSKYGRFTAHQDMDEKSRVVYLSKASLADEEVVLQFRHGGINIKTVAVVKNKGRRSCQK